jgi:hypothetical protein
LEAELLVQGQKPLSRSPARSRIEQIMLDYWRRGRTAYIAQCVGAAALGTDQTGMQ